MITANGQCYDSDCEEPLWGLRDGLRLKPDIEIDAEKSCDQRYGKSILRA